MTEYSKGDTIKLYGTEDDRLAIVLEDGLSSDEFYIKYVNKTFYRIYSHKGLDLDRLMYILQGETLISYVWYPVLVGDKKGWYAVLDIRAYDAVQ